MILDFNDAHIPLSSNDILERISEYDIFKYYCKSFVDLDKSFCSELRIDNNPGCRIYITPNNQLRYKDFASGENFDCWTYVMKKFRCSYPEAINIIASDFNLSNIKPNIEPRILLSNDEFKVKLQNTPREKSNITIVEQPWNLTDFNYWNQFGITLDILQEYNVFSAKYIYLNKGSKRYVFEYKKSNPSYAYRFTRDGQYSYKIYFPLHPDKKYKWLFSGGASEDVEGYDQLPLSGDDLILTKSLKDCMCYRVLGYSAISLQGEGNKLEQSLVDKLLKRFNRIIINYDSDERGILETNKLIRQYSFNCFYIDKHKDLSDYIKNEGLDKAKTMINDKIKNCI